MVWVQFKPWELIDLNYYSTESAILIYALVGLDLHT